VNCSRHLEEFSLRRAPVAREQDLIEAFQLKSISIKNPSRWMKALHAAHGLHADGTLAQEYTAKHLTE
jgi:hypothetical protein